MIEVQQTTESKPSISALSEAHHSAAEAESTDTAAVSELEMMSSAAKQMLQTLATQHSCKCQPIYSSTHVQQLLRACLSTFCRPRVAGSKGSAPAAEGRAPVAKDRALSVRNSAPGMTGSIAAGKGSAPAVKGRASPMAGAMASSAGQRLPIDLEMLDGVSDAANMACHDWQTLR